MLCFPVLLSLPVLIHLLACISFSVGVHCALERDASETCSEKYVVIIIFRMAICHLFTSSCWLLPHSWCCEAGSERTVVGVQGGWRTVVWAKAGGCVGVECDGEQTSALTIIVFWLASYFAITVFPLLPSWLGCFPSVQFIYKRCNKLSPHNTNDRTPSKSARNTQVSLCQTMWLEYQKLMVSDTESILILEATEGLMRVFKVSLCIHALFLKSSM